MAARKSIYTKDYAVFVETLREMRVERGVSQVDLAKGLGVTQSFISKCERGERRLDCIELRNWCRVLQMSLVEFAKELESELTP